MASEKVLSPDQAQAMVDLKAQGISDETVAHAKALGINFGGLLGLLMKFGNSAMVKNLIAELLSLVAQGSGVVSPPIPVAPPS